MNSKFKALLIFILISITTINLHATGYSLEARQKRDVSGFYEVEVSTGIEVILKLDDEESVYVEAKNDIIDDVITEVKNGSLHVYLKDRPGFNFFNRINYSSVKIYVTAIELNKIKSSAGAEIKSESTLKGENMELKASSGALVNTDMVYKNLKISASSGAQIKAGGRAKFLEVSTSSGAIINVQDIKAEYCKANASSGGNIKVFTTKEINARASSGGNIRYSGDPETKNINKSSGGAVYSR